MKHRTPLVYGLLIVAWGVIAGWQILEHRRVQESQRTALINRASEITSTLGQVISEQRRGGWGWFRSDGLVFIDRVEPTLKALIRPGEVDLVAVLNADGEIVASAEVPTDESGGAQAAANSPPVRRTIHRASDLMAQAQSTRKPAVSWEGDSVTVVNPVDIGETFILPRPTGRPPRDDRSRSRTSTESSSSNVVASPSGAAATGEARPETRTVTAGAPDSQSASGERPGGASEDRERFRRDRDGSPGRGRPPVMNENEYRSFRERHEKQILHGFAVVMSTAPFHAARGHDRWVRLMVTFFGTVAVLGLALAWRNVVRSSELQMRLLRASELNSHLREMNIAAAGLAHETRNPLNIIRGVAQMISKQTEASEEVRTKSREIIDEVDRVTAQLTEFINYSKPREIRRAALGLNAVINDVVRALKCDLEDKGIQLTTLGDTLTVDADEKLLRQVLFNLLMNAIQAVEPKGEIQIVVRKDHASGGVIEVRDNGPGVPLEHRQEIFRPYFTTNQKGTGLGLAVVQQIVLAHGWEIECLPNEPKGAVFRVSHLRLSPRS